MSEEPVLKVGQIWQEVDPRVTRFARILDIGKALRGPLPGTVVRANIQIRTVTKLLGDDWVFAPNSRPTWCDQKRFNGKRSGYKLHEDAP